jgi:hypothetical protein
MTRSGSSFRKALLLILFFFGVLIAFGAFSLLTVHAQTGGPAGTSSVTTIQRGGETFLKYKISSPPHPPASFDASGTSVDLSEASQAAAIHALTVPAYDWVFGCSSVSGAMIAGYYDRNGYPNMYTGPANGGVAPMDNSTTYWPEWTDVIADPYPNLPLAASHNGVDGRVIKGSLDDYWVSYASSTSDPYITGAWGPHAWSDAIGDYMKTSQSAYGLSDGATWFYDPTGATPLTCDYMATHSMTDDGTLGRKLFYEARGYTVTDCYSQNTDNQAAGGFSLAQFKAEIDAGRPVMLNLFTYPYGHTVVGVGYDDASSTIYINDTWDHTNHAMTWGGSYGNPSMELTSVSIVNLTTTTHAPVAFNKVSPANSATNQLPSVTLSWGAAQYAGSYEYCVDAVNNNACDSTWKTSGAANTSITVNGLSSGPHYWQVRAINPIGTTNANTNTWWSFNVQALQKVYMPLIFRPFPAPGGFNKASPGNGATGIATAPTLSWNASSGALSYQYCFDLSNDNICNGSGGAGGTTTWTSVGANTSVGISGLNQNTTYFWQVRAVNAGGDTYANSGAWWYFATAGASWTTIMSEDFEGTFPGSKWSLYGYNDYTWGKRNCRVYAGSYSGWGVGGGTGASLGCGSNYPQYTNSWMNYGPFSLSGATAADLSFQFWTNNGVIGSDPDTNDTLCAFASVDDYNYWGWCWWGSHAWTTGTLDLSNVYSLGNLMGQPNVWVAFTFITDGDGNTFSEGSYVDNIVLRKCTGSCPPGAPLQGAMDTSHMAPYQATRPK